MKTNNLKANSKQGFYFLAGINRPVTNLILRLYVTLIVTIHFMLILTEMFWYWIPMLFFGESPNWVHDQIFNHYYSILKKYQLFKH